MNKKTKRIRNRKNKTNKIRKYYGGFNEVNKEKNEGVLGIIGNKLSGYSGQVFDYVKNKGLRLAGLQEIKKEEESIIDDSTKEVDQKVSEIGNAASGIVSDVKKVFDEGSAAVIGNINGVLESPKVGQSLNEASAETAAIGEKLLDNFNEQLSTPEMKEQTKEALENASIVTEIAVDAFEKPLNKALDELNAAGTKATSGIVSGAIKVGTDALSAIPGVGAVVELGKIANDASKAAKDVVKATSDAASTVKELVEETRENIDEGLQKLDEKKEALEGVTFNPEATFKPEATVKPPQESLNELNKTGGSISNRVKKSIHQFENTNNTHLTGGYKTRRRLLKGKGKSKRVRFAI